MNYALVENYFDETVSKWVQRDIPINPKTQEEADKLYEALEYRMCDEVIYQDGQATETEACKTFNYYLNIAKKIEALGFKPTIDSDVFYPKGYIPKDFYRR
jgi:hypothetical protein